MHFGPVQQALLLLLEFKVIFGQINITSYGSLAVGSNLSLYCNIPSFNSSSASGSWYRNETFSTLCNNADFCTIKRDGNYSFTANSTGMSVQISPLEITENGVIWKCVISGEEAYFEIILQSPSPPPKGNQPVSGTTRSIHQTFTLYICLSLAMFAIYQYG
ncbi:uncharacterized protein LOC134721265 [Mytilus trossulus]|uniref:uncharacterized protein LOC134721265 n=1 Tax=Mytilus trossulus TaxID=6551 RepID=UPI003005A79E